jgi:hypothetical protein
MKANLTNAIVIITLHLAVIACSKLESNDMVFKKAINSDTLSSPVPGELSDPIKDSPVVLGEGPKAQDPVIVVGNNEPKTPTDVVTKEEEKTPTDVLTKEEEKTPTDVVTKEEPEVLYKESEIPKCLLDIEFDGGGSAASVAVASALKAELISTPMAGFESLSTSELDAMKEAVNSLSSSDSVQVIRNGAVFDKSFFPEGASVLVVVEGKNPLLKIAGLGKGARVFIMNVADKHNTVCLLAHGMTDSSKIFATVKGDTRYVSRATSDINGSGSIQSFMKVIGGNQTGSYFKANSMKDRQLTMITEGRIDTFSAIEAKSIDGGTYNIQVKGKDHTGFGVNANSMSNGQWNMEIQGEDDVSLLMAVPKIANNTVSGWLQAKSEAKLDPALVGAIELMTLP